MKRESKWPGAIETANQEGSRRHSCRCSRPSRDRVGPGANLHHRRPSLPALYSRALTCQCISVWQNFRSRCGLMRLGTLVLPSFLFYFIPFLSHAHLPPVKPGPLTKPSSSAQACSATEASCAEAAAKILPQVMGPSPMGE